MSKKLEERTTQEVLEHHLHFVQKADLEETLLDYCDETILINMGGPKQGLKEIGAFFKESMETCLPGDSVYESIHQYICGEMAYTVWKADSRFYKIPYGTDTFIIRNGKIVQQTFAGILEKK
jgi:hypothetical protein